MTARHPIQVLLGHVKLETTSIYTHVATDLLREVSVGPRKLTIRLGLNVYPVEVQQAINAHPDVVQCAGVGRTVGHNEKVVAFVEKAAGSSLDAAALALYLRDCLVPCKRPSDIRLLAVLPAPPTGTVLKKVLKTLAQDAAPPPPSVP